MAQYEPMTPTGSEQPQKSPGISHSSKPGGTNSGTLDAPGRYFTHRNRVRMSKPRGTRRRHEESIRDVRAMLAGVLPHDPELR